MPFLEPVRLTGALVVVSSLAGRSATKLDALRAKLGKDWPVIEDPASHGYYREEVGGLMIGMFEPVCAPWNVGKIPEDFSFAEIPPE